MQGFRPLQRTEKEQEGTTAEHDGVGHHDSKAFHDSGAEHNMRRHHHGEQENKEVAELNRLLLIRNTLGDGNDTADQ